MQLQQWVHHRVTLDDGAPLTPERYAEVREEEVAMLGARGGFARLDEAAELLDRLVLEGTPEEFLTLPAYERLA
jgi:malate synthase